MTDDEQNNGKRNLISSIMTDDILTEYSQYSVSINILFFRPERELSSMIIILIVPKGMNQTIVTFIDNVRKES